MTSSLSGRRFGNFDIGALIGAGGMGEVYRGRDTRLNRDVAIKVLLPAVAADAERLARFNREAQVLASLNHPNIAHIHGVEQGADGPLLVLEFVDGPTLADRIARGPLPVDEAVAIAKQVADALEAAHERGIVHRDLKPANIKVDDHGTVKVLDFGLAKAIDQGSGIGDQGAGSANSPTITTPAMTQAGIILGTAAYMSPEQAKGRVVDKRSDVWAFGCVLYEMLTGTRAFGGEDVTETIAAVVRGEPDWAKLPAATPPQIRLLLKRCLEKDRKARIADISVARFLIDEKLGAADAFAQPAARTATMIAAAVSIVVALLGVAGWAMWPRPTASAARQVRFELAVPPEQLTGVEPSVLIARDGSFIVYRASAGEPGDPANGLMVRAFNELEPRFLATGLARHPFISPDGKWIGYFTATHLRKIPVTGGPSEIICAFFGAPRGGSWGDDGQIVFTTTQSAGLLRVSAAGGEPQAVTDAGGERATDILPHVLPGSRSVVFTRLDTTARGIRVDAVDLTTGARKTLVPAAYAAQYVATGHIVFLQVAQDSSRTRRHVLRAARFDPVRVEIIGEPETMIDSIEVADLTLGVFSVSGNGDLVYATGGSRSDERTLLWVDRAGRETAIPAPPRPYATARLSPDGTRAALDVRDQTFDIWIWDFARQTLTPIGTDDALDQNPVWTADGRRVIWSSTRLRANPALFWQQADGAGVAEELAAPGRTQFASSVTPDGGTLLYSARESAGGDSGIHALSLGESNRSGRPLLATSASEGGAEVSPDGKWMAYGSNEAGSSQVFVRPYPNVHDGRWQVSSTGGSRPAWSRSGRELFFLDRDMRLTSVAVNVDARGAFSAGPPVNVLKTAYLAGRTSLGIVQRSYDIAPDGQRFLMIKEPLQDQNEEQRRPRIMIAVNWGEELKTRLPVSP